MNNLEILRKRISIQIIFYNAMLVLMLITYYILQGFDSKEFFSTFTLISRP